MSDNNKPKIAILRWEKGMVPKGLIQLEALPGNSTNPNTYPFPVRFVEVPGACAETVITHPDEKVLQSMTQICKTLEKDGIKLIATSCGFNAVFQQRGSCKYKHTFLFLIAASCFDNTGCYRKK